MELSFNFSSNLRVIHQPIRVYLMTGRVKTRFIEDGTFSDRQDVSRVCFQRSTCSPDKKCQRRAHNSPISTLIHVGFDQSITITQYSIDSDPACFANRCVCSRCRHIIGVHLHRILYKQYRPYACIGSSIQVFFCVCNQAQLATLIKKLQIINEEHPLS